MTKEIIAALCGLGGLILAGICLYAIGWIALGLYFSLILLLVAAVLATEPAKPV